MTAAKALAAQPILTALVACQTCGEWTDRCVCPDAATPHPGSRTPDGRLGVGDRGGRARALRVPARLSEGATSPRLAGGPGRPSPNTEHPAGPARRTQRASGVPNEGNPAMSSTDHATREARAWLDTTGRDRLVLPCTRAHRGVAIAGQLATRLDPTRTSTTHAQLRDLWDRIAVTVGSQSPDRWGLVTETAHQLRHLIREVEQ